MESTLDLPPAVDMRADLSPVEEQGHNQSCVANALAGCFEYLLRKANSYHDDVSCLFIYYNARLKKKPEKIVDVGCSVSDGIEALSDYGVCHQDLWPFDMKRLNIRPSTEAYASARLNYIKDAYKINRSLQEIKSCLAQGYPIIFGARLFQSFDKVRETGVIEMPNFSEPTRGEHPTHTMLIVGYDDSKKAFLVRNSWGKDWGHEDYCYMAYDYILSPALTFDLWTFRTLNCTTIKRDHWKEEIDWDFEPRRQEPVRRDEKNFEEYTEFLETKDYPIVTETSEWSSELRNYIETVSSTTTTYTIDFPEVHRKKTKKDSHKKKKHSKHYDSDSDSVYAASTNNYSDDEY